MVEKLIDVYKNAPSVENLYKILIYELDCDFVMISWAVSKQYWYIAYIYDSGMEKQIPDTGWYLNSEPDETNIPIKHSKLCNVLSIKSTLGKIIYAKITTHERTVSPRSIKGSTPIVELESVTRVDSLPPHTFIIDPTYRFIVEAFLDKIAYNDMIKRQKRMQEAMLSNISHSIRTPLNGILHMCNSIRESASTSGAEFNSGKVSEQLEYLNQSAVTLATNIFDIIDLTKLELGKLSLNKEVFNVREMITTVMSLANSLNKNKNVTLDYYVAPSVPDYIYSDRKRIKQILINLLENSLLYTTTGEISLLVDSTIINLSEEDSGRENSIVENSHGMYDTAIQHSISFIVKDTGSGMDEQTKSILFKPSEITTDTKQHGISLKISNMLSSLLNGKLSLVHSEPGKGSCFEFNIVACEEEMPERQTRTLNALKGKTVLLIDATSERIELCKVLEKYNMKYTISSTYEEAIILHSAKSFDMVIIHDDELEAYKDIKTHINVGILLGIGDVSKPTKLTMFTDVMSVPSNSEQYKVKILELFNSSSDHKNIFDKCKILVVEDEQINRIVIEKILRQLGYKKIYLAVNGHDALKQYDFVNPDIMLIDIRMPLMNGFELAEHVHHMCILRNTEEPKMLGVTAQVVLEDDIKPWFKDFVYKPIDIFELDKKIHELLNHSQNSLK